MSSYFPHVSLERWNEDCLQATAHHSPSHCDERRSVASRGARKRKIRASSAASESAMSGQPRPELRMREEDQSIDHLFFLIICYRSIGSNFCLANEIIWHRDSQVVPAFGILAVNLGRTSGKQKWPVQSNWLRLRLLKRWIRDMEQTKSKDVDWC